MRTQVEISMLTEGTGIHLSLYRNKRLDLLKLGSQSHAWEE